MWRKSTEVYQRKIRYLRRSWNWLLSRNEKSKKDWSNDERNLCPQTIICRLLRFKGKQRIMWGFKELKNAGIFIYEDFCKDTMDPHKQLCDKQLWDKVLEHWANNKISYLNYWSIVVRNQRNMAG